MAKDDYDVVVFRILVYLYAIFICIKKQREFLINSGSSLELIEMINGLRIFKLI